MIRIYQINIITAFFLLNSLLYGFEVDSFYRRNVEIRDSIDILNKEINTKIQNAVNKTNSCNIEELYTNVRNQINADSSGLGIIGGMENWAKRNNLIDRVESPPSEKSIYYGTSFESVTSIGFWLHLYYVALDTLKNGKTKTKLVIKKLLKGTSDPLSLCEVPLHLKDVAQKMLERGSYPEDRDKRPGFPTDGQVNSSGEKSPQEGFFDIHQNKGFPSPEMQDNLLCINDEKSKGHLKNMNEMQSALKELEEKGIMECLMAATDKKMQEKTGNLEPIINVNGTRMGCDKLGHFFDQGAEYFREAYEVRENAVIPKKDGLTKALKLGKEQEEGMFGLMGTKIKSYGDLAANYGGLLFWSSLTTGDNPITKCVDGKFQVVSNFNLKHYVTSAWDEGINCSEYKDEKFRSHIDKNLKLLNTKCPAESNKCLELKTLYESQVLNYIVSPECLNVINKHQQGEYL